MRLVPEIMLFINKYTRCWYTLCMRTVKANIGMGFPHLTRAFAACTYKDVLSMYAIFRHRSPLDCFLKKKITLKFQAQIQKVLSVGGGGLKFRFFLCFCHHILDSGRGNLDQYSMPATISPPTKHVDLLVGG